MRARDGVLPTVPGMADTDAFNAASERFHDIIAWGTQNSVYGFLIDALLEEVRVEIAQYLTPEQQEEHKKMLAEMDQRHRDARALMRAFPPPAATNAGK